MKKAGIWILSRIVFPAIVAIAAVFGAVPIVEPWYASWFGSFNPIVTFGPPLLGKGEGGILTVVLNIHVSNESSLSGCIRDLALRFEPISNKTSRILFPIFVIDMEKYIVLVEEERDPLKAVKSRFLPMYIRSHTTSEQTLMFIHRPVIENAPPDILLTSDLKPNHYVLELSVLKTEMPCLIDAAAEYTSVWSSSFQLTKEDLKDLNNDVTVLPLEEVVDRARHRHTRRP